MTQRFAPPASPSDQESGDVFRPVFDADGLIPAIVTDGDGGAILMFAWMNAEALSLTIETRVAHFYSRSRAKLWKKGAESGNLLHVTQLSTDCDQDVVALTVTVGGAGVACHTGARSCFYRAVEIGGTAGPNLALRVIAQPVVR
jgi:phosphoribosyl-AMP cyclohydrolase